jgi:hypothetical protein
MVRFGAVDTGVAKQRFEPCFDDGLARESLTVASSDGCRSTNLGPARGRRAVTGGWRSGLSAAAAVHAGELYRRAALRFPDAPCGDSWDNANATVGVTVRSGVLFLREAGVRHRVWRFRLPHWRQSERARSASTVGRAGRALIWFIRPSRSCSFLLLILVPVATIASWVDAVSGATCRVGRCRVGCQARRQLERTKRARFCYRSGGARSPRPRSSGQRLHRDSRIVPVRFLA